jgi:TRAP-type mannitol/chloroaromatic compound transport system permease large subunit
MIQMQTMAPLMFGGLVFVMLIGFPVAFSLAALGLFAGFISIELGFFPAQFMANLPLRIFGIISNDLLLAIPFFTFLSAAALLKICSKVPASCLEVCRVDWLSPLSSWVPSWAPLPAR